MYLEYHDKAYTKILKADSYLADPLPIAKRQESMDSSTDVREIQQPKDRNLLSEMTTLKNSILDMKKKKSNNLFTFAKAWPLVQQTPQGAKVIKEITRSTFDMQTKIHSLFEEVEKEI